MTTTNDDFKHVDCSIGWKYMPVDCLLGCLFSDNFLGTGRTENIPLDDIPDKCSLLIIGNYWKLEDMKKAVEKCSSVFWYAHASSDLDTYEELWDDLYVLHEPEVADALEPYREWAIPVMVRERGTGTLAGDWDWIYRGFTNIRDDEELDSLHEVFCRLKMLSDEGEKSTLVEFVENCRIDGKATCRSNMRNARKIAKKHSNIFTDKELNLSFLCGSRAI